MDDIRKAIAADIYYPGDKSNLNRMLNGFLSEVPSDTQDFFKKHSIHNLFGIVVPHAGYTYSGQTAAYAYSLLKGRHIETIILIGPSHRTDFSGFALSNARFFQTPFGKIRTNPFLATELEKQSGGHFRYLDSAHLEEHSLEVQLPFLQRVLQNNFEILPVLMGDQDANNVADGAKWLFKVLKDYSKNYLFVISNDLSAAQSAKDAVKMDKRFADLFLEKSARKLLTADSKGELESCGTGCVALLLELAKKFGAGEAKNLNYSHSGMVTGSDENVYGYLASVIY